MKNFKLLLLSFAIITSFFTSCTNNEPLTEDQNINESESITVVLNQLRQQFNVDGNVSTNQNPAGNIVFDFCFDFVYPIQLSYNNGTTVTINSLGDLIEVMLNSNTGLFINGIAFPFDVETYNNAGAIVVVTINNEAEFLDLLDDCEFNNMECECYENYDPVCVEIEAPNGDYFLITYPNACYAACDGFTPNDFAPDCEADYNSPGGNNCFTYNFPITIFTDNNTSITVNSQEELNTALYNSYNFTFDFPFEVTLENGDVVTINNEETLNGILEDCYNENDCPCPANVDPVCVEVQDETGGIEIISFLNACEAECEGYTEADFVDCETQQAPCDEQEIIQNLTECIWLANSSLQNNIVGYEFNSDGTLMLSNTGEPISGTWSIETEQNGDVHMYFDLPEPFNVVSNLDWTVTICEDDLIHIESGDESIIFTSDCDINNPSECSEQELFSFLLQCKWNINTSLYDTLNVEYIQFYQNGSLEIYSDETSQPVDGDWWLTANPAQEFLFMSFNIPTSPYDLFSEYDWFVVDCSEDYILLESGNEVITLHRDCD